MKKTGKFFKKNRYNFFMSQKNLHSDPDPVGFVYYWLSWNIVKVLDPYRDPYTEYTDPQLCLASYLFYLVTHLSQVSIKHSSLSLKRVPISQLKYSPCHVV